MIIFSKLGKKGNLGNQLFQIASTAGIAAENKQKYGFPDWEYSGFLKNQLPEINPSLAYNEVFEEHFYYHKWNLKTGNYDLNAWLQTEKYFDKGVRNLLAFHPKIENELLNSFKTLFEKKTILISVRRGDFVNHPLYFQLSYKYYFLALLKFFPDWRDFQLIFTSDEIDYCKFHFGHLPNAYFLKNHGPFEQLIISSHCDHFIISNSTFSWWQAWLGEKEHSVIVRPVKNHRNTKYVQFDDRDYFPERWKVFDHRKKAIPLKYIKMALKGDTYLFRKFLKNKTNGLKNRINKLLAKGI
ncbi:alpha-1,2-fucosyltransferase [Gramella jeungdoensis]|uniref:Alpha-1,2-fucosyltransferase n=1 Tax=Gramella jeungdoensis TaxID=708091 RepID=A0ABT0Z0F2_9FLAO|nr:alpha-1,2-fucosyltransferase [Gramella jeungdoensis]MCM8569194.1 alpha-1,2-fucosyltransferase [Gramella jeungdoensis]